MPLRVVNIISKRPFDFSNIETDSTVDVVVHRSIDVLYGDEAELCVRVHALTIQAGHGISVTATPVMLSPEEPSTDYLGSSVADAGLGSGVTAGDLIIDDFTTPFGSAVQIRVSGSKDGVDGTLTATISADLVLRDT